MNYDNYECKIVEVHSVALHGWPCHAEVTNPGKLLIGDIFKLLNALGGGDKDTPTCYWVVLSESELEERVARNQAREAHSQQVYKPRRKSSHSKSQKGAKSAEFVHDTSSSDSEGD